MLRVPRYIFKEGSGELVWIEFCSVVDLLLAVKDQEDVEWHLESINSYTA